MTREYTNNPSDPVWLDVLAIPVAVAILVAVKVILFAIFHLITGVLA